MDVDIRTEFPPGASTRAQRSRQTTPCAPFTEKSISVMIKIGGGQSLTDGIPFVPSEEEEKKT